MSEQQVTPPPTPAPATPAVEASGEDLFAQAMAAITASLNAPAEEPASAVETKPADSATEEAPPTPVDDLTHKLMAAEAARVEREAEAKALREELAKLKGQPAVDPKLFEADPAGFIKSLNPSMKLQEIAMALWNEALGENAPVDYKIKKAQSDAMRAQEALRQREEQIKQQTELASQQAAEMAYQQYVGALNVYVKAVPESMPLVKNFASKNPDRAQEALINIARQHAAANNGQILTPEQCAKALQTELEGLASVLTPASAPEPTPAPSAPATLRNKHQSIQPNRQAPDSADPEALYQHAMEQIRLMMTPG